MEDKKKHSKKVILIVLALICFICSMIYVGFYVYNQKQAIEETTSTTSPVEQSTKANTNPIDFETYQKGNNEIFAWIKIEDTKVDYPIVKSNGDDSFYLKHSAIDREWLASGAIYIEGCNTITMTDPITVIYGHNGYSDTMFTTLHYFEDQTFFNEHPYFNIYTPDSKLTYQVISAFKYDDRHIMNSFNFYNEDDLLAFQNEILNPTSAVKNVREELDVEINKDSKIVVLSTCVKGQKTNRYLVCGVLVKNEKTN